MARVRLTDRFVAGVKAAGGERQDYFDTVTRGLVLRVSAIGRKSWCLFCTSPRHGKRTRISLGAYPALGLAAARGRALEATGDSAAANRVIAVAQSRLLERAEKITDPALRTSFLERVPDNARTLERAAHWQSAPH